MFKITRSGESLGMTEAPNYIKQTETGCYNLCSEPEASGIAFAGKVYHLLGRPDLEGVDTIMLEETDAGAEIGKANEAGSIMFVTMAEGGQIDATTAAEHADLFAPWLTPSTTRPAISGGMAGCSISASRTIPPRPTGPRTPPPACGQSQRTRRRSGPPGASPSERTTPTAPGPR